MNEQQPSPLPSPASITIHKVGNGYICHSASKTFVFEEGNEIDMFYAIQKYFGFVAMEPLTPEEEEEGGISAEDLVSEV